MFIVSSNWVTPAIQCFASDQRQKKATRLKTLLFFTLTGASCPKQRARAFFKNVSRTLHYSGGEHSFRVRNWRSSVRVWVQVWLISQGGKGAGFRAGSEEDTYDSEGKRMFHVRGSSDMNAKAMQVRHVTSQSPVVYRSHSVNSL